MLLCNPSVWWCSHHLNRSRTRARHWERCRLLFLDSLLPVSGDHKSLFLHMSYSSLPKCPILCLHPLKHSLDRIWIWKIGSNIIKMWFQSILTKQGKTNSWNLQFDLHRKIKCQNISVMFLIFSCLYQHFYPSCAVDVMGTKVHLKWELGMWSNCHVAIIAKALITVLSQHHHNRICF